MCSGGQPKAQKQPKFKDPRLKNAEYQAVAKQLGIKQFNSASDIFQVEQYLAKQKEVATEERFDRMEQTQAVARQEDIARVERQYEETKEIQQEQFQQSMAAQQAALQDQLAAQAELQRRSEEAALRAQVPQLTANASNARRVRARSSSKQNARRAAFGASQLRVPLAIGGGGASAGSGTSPVKLNIGS